LVVFLNSQCNSARRVITLIALAVTGRLHASLYVNKNLTGILEYLLVPLKPRIWRIGSMEMNYWKRIVSKHVVVCRGRKFRG
jgi:hypothetical protein